VPTPVSVTTRIYSGIFGKGRYI